MKFMTSNRGALQAVEGPIISINEEIVVIGNKSLIKREPGSKFLIKKKLGSKSLAKREFGQVLG